MTECDCFASGEELCCNIDGRCDAGDQTGSIGLCIHCGAEMIRVGGEWFHWSQFDANGDLFPDSPPQSFLKLSGAAESAKTGNKNYVE